MSWLHASPPQKPGLSDGYIFTRADWLGPPRAMGFCEDGVGAPHSMSFGLRLT